MTIATVIELVAAFVLPVVVIAAGHSDWVLPSIVITIGPLLLWLDHLVHIPRYRPVGWALIAGPVILVATMSGSALAVTTGLAAGVVLLGTAAAGFHDLAGLRPPPAGPGPAQHEGPMIMPQADSPVTGFRPFFNPATGEWITYTALAEDSDGQLVRFTWRSVPGGVITEHIHPRQEERFTILAGQAHFTLNGAELVAGAGETVVVPAGVPHSEGNPGPAEIEGVVELRPALRTKEWHEALAGLVADGKTTPRGAPQQPAPARRHLLALPPRKPGHLTADLGAEPHAPPAVGAGEGLRRPPLLRPLGQPDPRSGLTPPGSYPGGTLR